MKDGKMTVGMIRKRKEEEKKRKRESGRKEGRVMTRWNMKACGMRREGRCEKPLILVLSMPVCDLSGSDSLPHYPFLEKRREGEDNGSMAAKQACAAMKRKGKKLFEN